LIEEAGDVWKGSKSHPELETSLLDRPKMFLYETPRNASDNYRLHHVNTCTNEAQEGGHYGTWISVARIISLEACRDFVNPICFRIAQFSKRREPGATTADEMRCDVM
jgi:hypothetical protein